MTGNTPGTVNCSSVADPSSVVEMIRRPATSHSTLARTVAASVSPRSSRVDTTRYPPVRLLIRAKIGMYIAMTMPPTMPPSKAIINGSSRVRRPATATSTSSS